MKKEKKKDQGRKTIITIILSFRKFWDRESWVHQRPFATFTGSANMISFNQTVNKTRSKSKVNVQALCVRLSSAIYMTCLLSSSPWLPTCCTCKKFGSGNIFLNCLSLYNKPCFCPFPHKCGFGKKILLHFHYFSKHFEILLHFMNVCREGDGIHIKVHADSWYMNLTLHQSVRRPWLCCAVASGDSGIFTFVPLFPIFSLRMYTILDSHLTKMLNNKWM